MTPTIAPVQVRFRRAWPLLLLIPLALAFVAPSESASQDAGRTPVVEHATLRFLHRSKTPSQSESFWSFESAGGSVSWQTGKEFMAAMKLDAKAASSNMALLDELARQGWEVVEFAVVATGANHELAMTYVDTTTHWLLRRRR